MRVTFCFLPSYVSLFTFAFSLFFSPAFDVPLLAGAHGERSRRHVLANRRPAPDVGALANRDGRDELRVAADERAVFDDRRVLLHAVVVAGDRAGADVHIL